MSDRIDIEQLAEELVGTCKSLDEAIDPESLTLEECDELDSIVRCCETCGWWVSIDDIGEDGTTCIDCELDEE